MKLRQRLPAYILLFFLTAPMLIYPLLREYVDVRNLENRTLAEFADVVSAPVSAKPYYFSRYFNDNLPFKNQMVTLNSLVSMRLLGVTSSPLVMLGEDGWLFFNNMGQDNPIEDVTGVTVFSEEELAAALGNVIERQDGLAGQGVDFHVLLVPNKEAVYGEYLPEYIRSRAVGESRTDRLAAFLKGGGAPVVYPKDSLETGKASARLYYKYDSHWNHLGAYAAARELFAELGLALPAAESYETTYTEARKDLADMAGIGGFCNDDSSPWTEGFMSGVTYESEQIDVGIARHKSDAADKRTVLVIGDSYFESLKPYFCLCFAEVIEVNRNAASYSPDALIELYEPDAVILEAVERASSILLHEDVLS